MKTIDIYTTPTCGFCKMLKAWLKSKNIPYTEHDVTTSDDALNEMQQMAPGNLSVPVVVFNKGQQDQEVQIGYDQAKISKAILP